MNSIINKLKNGEKLSEKEIKELKDGATNE